MLQDIYRLYNNAPRRRRLSCNELVAMHVDLKLSLSGYII